MLHVILRKERHSMNMTLLPGLVTALAVLLFMTTAALVGRARGKFGVKAPATAGHPDFERTFRVQMNTLEALAIFLPALWLAATYWNAEYAGYIGLVWVLARVWYAAAYMADAARRGPAFILGMVSAMTLLFGGLIGLLNRMFG
jgi:uncharacterized MAPEG superfamily protein